MVFIFVGCSFSPGESPIEKAYSEQADQNKAEKDKKESLEKQILDNIKKNSENSINNVIEGSKNASSKPKAPSDRTFDEEIDYATEKFSGSVWGAVFSVLFALQKIALPASLLFIILGSFLAYIFRNDKPRFRWFIIMAVGGPLLFIVITYLPAFLWYIIKN